LTTIYSELLTAAGKGFLPQAEGEPDAHYLRRLVLAVSKCSDEAWDALSKAAQDWYNEQAKRVKAHQDPEHCPGFGGSFAQWEHEHKDDQIPAIVDAVVDAGWPLNPAMVGECGYPAEELKNAATALADAALGPITPGDQDSPHALSPKPTATDAVRALVMQHQDWNQSQIAAELEARGQTVSLGTIATVRSMTLATIAVAKGLGKWVEG
jgi:hypothetical protein